MGGSVGPNLQNLELLTYRTSALPLTSSIPYYTGDKDVEFRGDYETDGHIVVKQEQPLPLNVVALFPRLNTFDG
jgi:hypothetical protein